MVLMIEKHIDFKGEKARLISRALTDAVRDFEMRVRMRRLKKIKVFVTMDPVKVCKTIVFPRVKLRRHSEMREWVCENAPSFSYWERGKTPIIMIDAHEKVFKGRNYKAIKGLLAHELMHIMDKLEGTDEKLENVAEKSAKNIFCFLAKHKEKEPFTRDRLLASLIRITTSMILFIKDILANTRAMSFGFDDELYENYKISLENVREEIRFTEKNIVKMLKKNKKHFLDDAFLAYLGLNVSWIPFKMFHNKWYRELQKLARIEVPRIIKKNCDPILKEMLNIRSASNTKTIMKVLNLSQQNYFKVVQYFCKKLR